MEVLFSLPPRSLPYNLHRHYKDLSFSPIACACLFRKLPLQLCCPLCGQQSGIRPPLPPMVMAGTTPSASHPLPLWSLLAWAPPLLRPSLPPLGICWVPGDLQSPRETTHVSRASWCSDLSGCLCGRALRKPGVSLLLSKGPFFSLPLSGFLVLEAAKCPRGFHDPKESRI